MQLFILFFVQILPFLTINDEFLYSCIFTPVFSISFNCHYFRLIDVVSYFLDIIQFNHFCTFGCLFF